MGANPCELAEPDRVEVLEDVLDARRETSGVAALPGGAADTRRTSQRRSAAIDAEPEAVVTNVRALELQENVTWLATDVMPGSLDKKITVNPEDVDPARMDRLVQ